MKAILAVLLVLAVTGCGKENNATDVSTQSALKSCVEQEGVDLLQLCFNGDKPAYTAWKDCAARGTDKVKCYQSFNQKIADDYNVVCSGLSKEELVRQCFAGNTIDFSRYQDCLDRAAPGDKLKCFTVSGRIAYRLPQRPQAADIDCGSTPYVCFRYYVVRPDEADFTALAGVLAGDASSLRQNAFCEFKSHPDRSRILIKQRASGYRFTFDRLEGDIACNGTSTADSDFLTLIARNVVLNADTNVVDGGNASWVQVNRGEIFNLGDTNYFRLKATSVAQNGQIYNIGGNYAAIAKSRTDEKYMIIFDGKFDASGQQEP